MSFLNSVLSSIGGDATKPIEPAAKTASAAIVRNGTSRPTSDRNGQVLATSGASSTVKRKAENELSCPKEKLIKTEATLSKPIVNGAQRRPLPTTRPTVQTSNTIPAGSYLGTSKPSPITPTAPESKAPPKKGSYAEIMARGRVAQAIVPSVGAITHKPKEKLSTKKELLLQRKGLHPKNKSGSPGKTAPGSKSSSPGPLLQNQDAKSNGKKAPSIGYSGTAKPKQQTSYKGTMKPVSSSISTSRKQHQGASDDSDHSTTRRKPVPSNRRRNVYSDEDSQGEEESYESGSDLSDMEAGFSDVEEEDERAAREAKKEDEREMKMLEEAKIQKEARRKRLEELAKKGQRR